MGQLARTTTNPAAHWTSCKPSEYVKHHGDDRRVQGGSNPGAEEGNKSLLPLGQYLQCKANTFWLVSWEHGDGASRKLMPDMTNGWFDTNSMVPAKHIYLNDTASTGRGYLERNFPTSIYNRSSAKLNPMDVHFLLCEPAYLRG